MEFGHYEQILCFVFILAEIDFEEYFRIIAMLLIML